MAHMYKKKKKIWVHKVTTGHMQKKERKEELTVRPGILGNLPPNNLSHNSWAVALPLRQCLQAARVHLSAIFHPLKARANILPIPHRTTGGAEPELRQDREEGVHRLGHPVGQDGAPPLHGAQEPDVGGVQVQDVPDVDGKPSLGVVGRDRRGRRGPDQRIGFREGVGPARRVRRGAVPVELGDELGEADGHGRLGQGQGRIPPALDRGDQPEQGGRAGESIGLGDGGDLRGELVGGGGGTGPDFCRRLRNDSAGQSRKEEECRRA